MKKNKKLESIKKLQQLKKFIEKYVKLIKMTIAHNKITKTKAKYKEMLKAHKCFKKIKKY